LFSRAAGRCGVSGPRRSRTGRALQRGSLMCRITTSSVHSTKRERGRNVICIHMLNVVARALARTLLRTMRLSARVALGPKPRSKEGSARPRLAGSAACSAVVFRQGRHAPRASGRTLQGQIDPPARPRGVADTCIWPTPVGSVPYVCVYVCTVPPKASVTTKTQGSRWVEEQHLVAEVARRGCAPKERPWEAMPVSSVRGSQQLVVEVVPTGRNPGGLALGAGPRGPTPRSRSQLGLRSAPCSPSRSQRPATTVHQRT